MEGAALLIHAFDPDASAHCFGEASAEIEAKAGATNLTSVGVVDTIELLE
jgi:hypothetical protein